MNDLILHVDAQRSRWENCRSKYMIDDAVVDEFAAGGLAAYAHDLDVRILFLPSDPMQAALVPDEASLEWLRETRASPYGGDPWRWGSLTRGVRDAVVLYDQYRNEGWSRYLALHHHGGLEVGCSLSHSASNDVRVFALRPIVGMLWSISALQEQAVDRWGLQSPYELTVAVRQTKGATLGTFAEGWAQPGYGLYDYSLCLDANVLLRFEITDHIVPEDLALSAGARLELAFGSPRRRHLARIGAYEGRFDPRF